MVKKRVMFTFPEDAVKDPIIHNLGQQFKVAVNIRGAEISDAKGWALLELDGDDKDIEDGLAWATSRGVRVDVVEG